MQVKSERRSVDLSGYPDLVVIYLGLTVTRWRGVLTLLGFGRGLTDLQRNKPEGLLAHEAMLYSLRHVGFRQYWRDLDSLERFTRSEPHKTWWRQFSRDPQGTGFWHETYTLKGGMEAIYISMPDAHGFGRFAPDRPPQGPFMTARNRLTATPAAP